jgi:hypothetical protein
MTIDMTLTMTEYENIIQDNSLITLEELSMEKKMLDVLTLLPYIWKFNRISLENYKENFKVQNKEFDYIIKNTTNIVVAGGAAFKALYPDRCNYSDVDVFIYGISEQDMWAKVNEIVDKLFIQHVNAKISQYIKKGLLVILVSTSEITLEYQIILNTYTDIYDILSKFDLPCCCIAYDGQNVYMTKAGAYSHTTQTNVVNIGYVSNTYESRLEKYFDRGFGIALPEYDINSIDNNSDIIVNSKLRTSNTVFIKNNVYCCFMYRSYMTEQEHYSHIEDFSDFPDLDLERGIYLTELNTKKIDYIEFGNKTSHEIIKNDNYLLKKLYKKIVTRYISDLDSTNVLEIMSIISKINIDNLLMSADYKPIFICKEKPLGTIKLESYNEFYSL